MQRMIPIAAILLIIQIGLAAAVLIKKDEYLPFEPNSPVASFSPNAIDRIILASDSEELQLIKNDGNWFLDGSPGVSANDQQIATLLDTLSGLKKTLSVATSESAAARFKVAQNSFAHHVVLESAGKQMADLYFGTSPGFKQIHLRSGESNDIMTAALGGHELSPETEQWIDKSLLKTEKQKIKSIAIQHYVLHKEQGGSWAATVPEDYQTPTTETIEQLVDKLSGLSANDYLEPGNNGEKHPILQYSISVENDGDEVHFTVSELSEDDCIVHRSDLNFGLKVSTWQIDEITTLLKEHFSPQPEEEKTENKDQG